MSSGATGLRAWLLQRISAVYLALFFLIVPGYLLLHPPASYGQWRHWLGHPWVGVALSMFFLALLLHAWIGVRDVVMDYIPALSLRLLLLTLTALALTACGLWVLQLLFSLHSAAP